MLRKLLGPEREELTTGWRKLHNGQHHDLHLSPDVNWVIRYWQMTCVGQVAHVGEKRSVYRILVGKLEGQLCRPIHRWEVNIKMDVKEIQ